MAKILFDNGKEVTLSAKTTERLKKELLKPEKFSFSMDWFHCGERENMDLTNSYPYYIVVGCDFTAENKPTIQQIDRDAGFFFSKEDVEKMITNLQKMISE